MIAARDGWKQTGKCSSRIIADGFCFERNLWRRVELCCVAEWHSARVVIEDTPGCARPGGFPIRDTADFQSALQRSAARCRSAAQWFLRKRLRNPVRPLNADGDAAARRLHHPGYCQKGVRLEASPPILSRYMKVLITGSSGLIGSEAVAHYDREGHEVHGVDNNMRREFFGPQGDTRWNLD